LASKGFLSVVTLGGVERFVGGVNVGRGDKAILSLAPTDWDLKRFWSLGANLEVVSSSFSGSVSDSLDLDFVCNMKGEKRRVVENLAKKGKEWQCYPNSIKFG